jgi:cell division protein FtsI (penicillin-binding protein 3)
MEEKKDILWRIYIVYFVIAVMALSVIGRIVFLQTVEDAQWESMAKEQSIKEQNIKSARGNIYSSKMNLLSTSIPMFNLYWDSKVVHQDSFHKYLDPLAREYTNIFPDEGHNAFKNRLKTAYAQGKRYYRIRKKVEYAELKKVMKLPLFNLGKYSGGLITEKYERRKRPYRMLAQRTIGIYNNYLQKYNVGLEGAYDPWLKGEDGVRLVQKTSGGWRTLNIYNENIKEPKNGRDVITTIDINLQDVAENSLYRELMKHSAKWGSAILMEVETGEIKAIVNLTRDTANNSYHEDYNYAIGTAITPGSTFKLPSLIVALKDKKIKLSDVIATGNGVIKYYGSTMKDSHRGGYGDITVQEVFEKSSNVGIFKIILNAYEQNPQKFIDGLYELGLHKALGIEIKGEKTPFIKDTDHKDWSKLSLPWMSIGYELTMTPLQILTLYNAVANNGTMVKPMFVKEIREVNKVVKHFEPVVLQEQIAPQDVIADAQKMLEGVVTKGTGQGLKSSPYAVAGKTGTAQIYNKGTYNNNNYIASFVGYFPADKPKYSCIVVVYDPRKGIYYASQVAVPVFKDIADKIYATELDIQKNVLPWKEKQLPASKVGLGSDINMVMNELGIKAPQLKQKDGQWVYCYGDDKQLAVKERILEDDIMPNVKGMNARDAIYLLEQRGLKVSFVGYGKVVDQSIQPNMPIQSGSGILLTLREG